MISVKKAKWYDANKAIELLKKHNNPQMLIQLKRTKIWTIPFVLRAITESFNKQLNYNIWSQFDIRTQHNVEILKLLILTDLGNLSKLFYDPKNEPNIMVWAENEIFEKGSKNDILHHFLLKTFSDYEFAKDCIKKEVHKKSDIFYYMRDQKKIKKDNLNQLDHKLFADFGSVVLLNMDDSILYHSKEKMLAAIKDDPDVFYSIHNYYKKHLKLTISAEYVWQTLKYDVSINTIYRLYCEDPDDFYDNSMKYEDLAMECFAYACKIISTTSEKFNVTESSAADMLLSRVGRPKIKRDVFCDIYLFIFTE